MKPKKIDIKAVIFDLDGTLIDSDKDIVRLINLIRAKFLKKKKINIKKIANYSSIGGNKLIINTLSKKKPKFFLKIFRNLYNNIKIRKDLIFPGVVNFLRFLKSKKIKIYICTNKPKFLTSKIVKTTILNKYIDNFFCSDEFNYKKPNKIFFLKILKKIDIKKEKILFIGDSLIDYQFCKNSSLDFILYKNKRISYPKDIYFKLSKSNKILFSYNNSKQLKELFFNIK